MKGHNDISTMWKQNVYEPIYRDVREAAPSLDTQQSYCKG